MSTGGAFFISGMPRFYYERSELENLGRRNVLFLMPRCERPALFYHYLIIFRLEQLGRRFVGPPSFKTTPGL